MSTITPTPSKALIFGREPAFWIGVIEALLALLLSWNILGLSADQIGGIMAVLVGLAGIYTAYVTRDTMLGVLVGLAKATFILLATFQINLTEAQMTTAIALITVLGGAFNRAQTAPALVPGFKDPSPSAEIPVPVDTTPTPVHRGEGGYLHPIISLAIGILLVVILVFVLLRIAG